MATTPQNQAINGANEVAQASQRLWTQYISLLSIRQRSLLQNWAIIWGRLPTATLNSDGTLGAADSVPVNGNPIDTRIVNNLTITASSEQYVIALSLVDSFAALGQNSDTITASMPFIGSGG